MLAVKACLSKKKLMNNKLNRILVIVFLLSIILFNYGCARVVSGLASRVLSVEIELAADRDPSAYYYLVFNTAGQPPVIPNPLRGYFYTPDDPNFQFDLASDYLPTWTHYIVLGPEGFYKLIKGPFVSGATFVPEYLEVFSGPANKFLLQFTLNRFGTEDLNTINFNFITVNTDRQVVDKLGFDYALAPVEAGVSVAVSPEGGDALDSFGQNVPSLDILGGVVMIE